MLFSFAITNFRSRVLSVSPKYGEKVENVKDRDTYRGKRGKTECIGIRWGKRKRQGKVRGGSVSRKPTRRDAAGRGGTRRDGIPFLSLSSLTLGPFLLDPRKEISSLSLFLVATLHGWGGTEGYFRPTKVCLCRGE